MALTHTIFPSFVPEGYFDQDNIDFIRDKITSILGREYRQSVIMDKASIVRIMQRVLEERLETIPRMNQRVLMYLADSFRIHQADLTKKLKWENGYVESQSLYDPTVERGPDLYNIKLSNRLGKPRVGGTARFYFT